MGLNDSFRSQILLNDPLPPINKVFSLIVQEERQRAVTNSYNASVSSNGMAFALKWERSQFQSLGRNQQKFQKGRPFCTNCNIPGHTVDTCYKLHGYPPGYKNRNKPGNKTLNLTVHQVSESTTSNLFIILTRLKWSS